MSEPSSAKAPRHLWIVGVVSLLWNAMGAFDYTMTQTRNETYLAEFPSEMLEYVESFPTWAVACWATAVWFALLGSILLLLRKGLAAPVFAVSFVAMLGSTVYSYALSDGLAMMGPSGAAFSAVIFVVALLLVVYSRRMRAAGVLS